MASVFQSPVKKEEGVASVFQFTVRKERGLFVLAPSEERGERGLCVLVYSVEGGRGLWFSVSSGRGWCGLIVLAPIEGGRGRGLWVSASSEGGMACISVSDGGLASGPVSPTKEEGCGLCQLE